MKKNLFLIMTVAMALCLAITSIAAPSVAADAKGEDASLFGDIELFADTDTLEHAPESVIKASQLMAAAVRLHSELNDGGLGQEYNLDTYYAYALSSGIFADGVYTSEDQIPTRAQVVTALYNAVNGKIDLTAINTVLDMIDVDPNANYFAAASAFMQAGIITGYDEYGSFKPDKNVKWYELGLMIDRLLNPSERVTKKYIVYSSDEPFYLIDDFQLDTGANSWKTGGSGWRIDYTGSDEIGTINNYANVLRDFSDVDNMSTSRRIHTQENGELVFESVYKFTLGDTLEFAFYDFEGKKVASAGWMNGTAYVGTVQSDVTLSDCKQASDLADDNNRPNSDSLLAGKVRTRIVLNLDTKVYEVWMGKNCIGQQPLNASNIAKVEISTDIAEATAVELDNTHLWKNYRVNDVFRLENQGDAPVGYDVQGDVTVERFFANATNTGEINSMKMNVTAGNKTYAKKNFDKANGKVVMEAYVLLDDVAAETGTTVQNSAYFTAKSSDTAVITVKNTGNKWYANGTELTLTTKNNVFTSNVWQLIRIEADTNTQKALVKINGKDAAENIPFLVKVDGFDSLEIGVDATADDTVWFDDIEVYETFEYDDYCPEPVPLDTGNYIINMSVCNLWRNGSHYGWDWIRPYAEIEPASGYYDEGIPEEMDWEIKYLTEHGIKNYMACWYPLSQKVPTKKPRMIDAIHDGYFNAKYSDKMSFSIMFENSNYYNDDHLADFKNSVFPLWMDWYFSDPRYCRIEEDGYEYIFLTIYKSNLFIDMCCTSHNLITTSADKYNWAYAYDSTEMTTGYSETKNMIKWMNDQIVEAGYADGLIVCFGGSLNGANEYDTMAKSGADGVILYAWGESAWDVSTQKRLATDHTATAKGKNLDLLTLATPGFNEIGWTTLRPGYMTTSNFVDMLTWHKEQMATNFGTNEDSWKSKFITLDTWNEYGEGHYLFPTYDPNGEINSKFGYGGFGYLDAVAQVFGGVTVGSDAANANNIYPTAIQKARIGHLYPDDIDHYIRREMLVDETSVDKYIELGGWDFTQNTTNMDKALENSPGNWKNLATGISALWTKDYFQYDSTNKCWYGTTNSTGATITLSDPESKVFGKVNLDEVDYVYLKLGTSSGGATGKIYFTTTTDSNPGIQDEEQALKYNFETYAGASGTEYYFPASAFNGFSGVINGVRLDPAYKSGENVYIHALKFLKENPDSYKTAITVDGQKYTHKDFAEIREENRNEVYITATEEQGLYKLLHIVYDWNRNTNILKLDTPDGTTFQFTEGSKTVLVNGKSQTLDKAFYLYDGAPVLPLIFVLKNANYNYAYDFTNKKLDVIVANKFRLVDGVVNGNAEDLSNTTAFTGYNNQQQTVAIAVDPENSSNHAWKYTSAQAQGWNYISTPVDFVPGKTYTLDFDVYFDSVGANGTAPSTSGVISVNPRYSDVAGTIADHNSPIATQSVAHKTWTHVTRTFTINDTYIAGTGQMAVYMNPVDGLGCTYYIDNFVLRGEPVAFKIVNGDAEGSDTSAFINGGDANNTVSIKSDGSNKYWQSETSVTNEKRWNYIAQDTSFEKGVTYYVKLRAKIGNNAAGTATSTSITLNVRYADRLQLDSTGEWYAHNRNLTDKNGNTITFNSGSDWVDCYGTFTISQGYVPIAEFVVPSGKTIPKEQISFYASPDATCGITFMIDDLQATTDPDVYAGW